jgi:hypothetical protein
MKLIELEILKISYFESFLSCYMILEVIWQKQFEFENLGVLQCTSESGQCSARHGR